MQEMVKNILLAMQDTIQGADWMDEATKKKALEKLSTFNPKIGYPDKWKDYSRRRRSGAPRTGTMSSPPRAGTSTTTARRSASRSIAAAGA